MPLMGGFSPGIKKEELEQILQTGKDKTDAILKIVQDLQDRLEKHYFMLSKLVALMSKMYQDGELNKDTFNKLDQFLKEYYENPYKEQD